VHGWWVDSEGRRIDAIAAVAFVRFVGVRWRECHDCIAGISSCCDGAGSAQPESEDDHD
jgi:hypothetical protein